jgi:hypothetical protein
MNFFKPYLPSCIKGIELLRHIIYQYRLLEICSGFTETFDGLERELPVQLLPVLLLPQRFLCFDFHAFFDERVSLLRWDLF